MVTYTIIYICMMPQTEMIVLTTRFVEAVSLIVFSDMYS